MGILLSHPPHLMTYANDEILFAGIPSSSWPREKLHELTVESRQLVKRYETYSDVEYYLALLFLFIYFPVFVLLALDWYYYTDPAKNEMKKAYVAFYSRWSVRRPVFENNNNT